MIEYLVSMKSKIYSTEKEDNKLLLLFGFFYRRLKIMNKCNGLLFSLKYAMRTFTFVPKYTQGPQEIGLNLFPTIKLFSFGCSLQKQFVGLNCFHLTSCCIACKFY